MRGSILRIKVSLLLALGLVVLCSSAVYAETEHTSRDYLRSACTRAGCGGSVKSIAISLKNAGLSFTNIDDLYSFRCENNLTLFETMILNANYTQFRKYLYYMKTRGKDVEGLLNYPIPNRYHNKEGFHTLLDYIDYMQDLDDDPEGNHIVRKTRKMMVEYGAKKLSSDDTYLEVR